MNIDELFEFNDDFLDVECSQQGKANLKTKLRFMQHILKYLIRIILKYLLI